MSLYRSWWVQKILAIVCVPVACIIAAWGVHDDYDRRFS